MSSKLVFTAGQALGLGLGIGLVIGVGGTESSAKRAKRKGLLVSQKDFKRLEAKVAELESNYSYKPLHELTNKYETQFTKIEMQLSNLEKLIKESS